ncbi:MAG TPA: Holliday junction branch migration protein RuvA, partial [Nautiliaceae bacterium]|nr:Holliday junction branch migration protein RuvA [Nautiliaceae bacterium]
MIAGLKGKIFTKDNGKILLDVNSVIYEINVSMITFSLAKDEVLFYI